MSDKNTEGTLEFIIEHIWWACIVWIWYKNILFRCIGMHSLRESKRILLVMILCCSIVGIVLEIKKQRNGISVLLNLTAGYGLYSAFAYYPIRQSLIRVTFSAATIFLVTYSLLILCRKIKNKRKRKKIVVQRIIKVFSLTRKTICVGFAVIMISIGFKAVWDTSLIRPSVAPAQQSNDEKQTIANNIKTLALLK